MDYLVSTSIILFLITTAFITIFYIWPLSYKQQLKALKLPLNSKIVVKFSMNSQSPPLSRLFANHILQCFFHPFCDNGGGGERVLWMGIKALQDKQPDTICVIYTWSGADFKNIPSKVKQQFGLDLDPIKLCFLPLQSWKYLEAKRYPRMTLIVSSLGSLIPGWEAMQLLRPRLFVESVGFAFIYPLAWFFGAKVVAYVHYPTISSDMLKLVKNREHSFNNQSSVAKSSFLSFLKLQYYRLFSLVYGTVGSFCDLAMVNSSWTAGHIIEIWRIKSRTKIVFPPCDTSKLIEFPFTGRSRIILSVAQFRPEKDHFIQLKVLKELFKRHPEYESGQQRLKLVLLGSVRNKEDEELVTRISQVVDTLKLRENVEIVRNAPYAELLNYLRISLVGIHSMKNEHFGISLIEYMAAGLICLAHDSAGPKMDIVKNEKSGFLAQDVKGYADALDTILKLSPKSLLEIQKEARQYVTAKFSEKIFADSFISCLQEFL